jgi:hypothetical protein
VLEEVMLRFLTHAIGRKSRKKYTYALVWVNTMRDPNFHCEVMGEVMGEAAGTVDLEAANSMRDPEFIGQSQSWQKRQEHLETAGRLLKREQHNALLTN